LAMRAHQIPQCMASYCTLPLSRRTAARGKRAFRCLLSLAGMSLPRGSAKQIVPQILFRKSKISSSQCPPDQFTGTKVTSLLGISVKELVSLFKACKISFLPIGKSDCGWKLTTPLRLQTRTK